MLFVHYIPYTDTFGKFCPKSELKLEKAWNISNRRDVTILKHD